MASKFVRCIKNVEDINQLSDNVTEENDIVSDVNGNIYIRKDVGFHKLYDGDGIDVDEKLEEIIKDIESLEKDLNKIDLTIYAKKSDLVEYVKEGDLTLYAKKTDLDTYTKKSDLTLYAKFSDLDTYAKKSELAVYVKVTDLNIVNEKISKIYGLSNTPVNIYVDLNNDAIGDGTEKNPFNTIQKAFDSIPKIIDKRYTVWIAPGDYKEEAYLTGVIGGTIFIRSTEPPETVDNINVRVKALNFYDIMGYVHIEDMGTFGGEINRKAFILFSRCIYGSVSRCLMDRKIPNKITLYWDGSFGSLGTSHLSNQDLCIQSQNGSTVRIDDNTTSGTGNVVALYSLNGFIFKSGSNNWIQSASIPEKKDIGGKIYGEKTEWNKLSYLNEWNTQSGVDLKYKKISDDLVFLYGWVNKQPLDLTTIATLPVGVRPVNTQRNLVTVTGTAVVQDAPPVLTINSNGEIKLVNTGTVPPNNGIAINIVYPIL